MIDHILGRPSNAHRRYQVLLIIALWIARIRFGSPYPPKVLQPLVRRFRKLSPWQTVLATLTGMYALRNLRHILGLQAPEPLARLYSRNFYRASWIITALDCGHGTAMHIRPAWLRHYLSVVFSLYFVVFSEEAEAIQRKYRAVPTVEFLRVSAWDSL